MAHFPGITPPSTFPNSVVVSLLQGLATKELPPAPDAAPILTSLRASVADRTREPDAILASIAAAAQSLTCADGAAIALRREGIIICLGRSGDVAPVLGARLSVDSGISGECLRTGKTLRCDDTNKDQRADPQVCRELGLRSIAAVPLRQGESIAGVLEAFSSRAYAFAEEHMNFLARLAELAESVASRESTVDPPPSLQEQAPEIADASPALLRLSRALTTGLHDALRAQRKRRYWTLCAVLGGLLIWLSILGWNAWWRAAPSVSAAKRPVAQNVRKIPVMAVAAPAAKPSPTRTLDRPVASANRPAQSFGLISVPDVVLRREIFPPRTNPVSTPPAGKASEGTADSNGNEVPTLAAPGGDASQLTGLLATSVTLPQFGAPVSQGFSGGTLLHWVRPLYPAQALPLRLEGKVTLQGTIMENGEIQDLKVVNGDPTLARAALDAVRQWRYRPFKLNGKPIRKQTDVTVSFKAP